MLAAEFTRADPHFALPTDLINLRSPTDVAAPAGARRGHSQPCPVIGSAASGQGVKPGDRLLITESAVEVMNDDQFEAQPLQR